MSHNPLLSFTLLFTLLFKLNWFGHWVLNLYVGFCVLGIDCPSPSITFWEFLYFGHKVFQVHLVVFPILTLASAISPRSLGFFCWEWFETQIWMVGWVHSLLLGFHCFSGLSADRALRSVCILTHVYTHICICLCSYPSVNILKTIKPYWYL